VHKLIALAEATRPAPCPHPPQKKNQKAQGGGENEGAGEELDEVGEEGDCCGNEARF
jgi:hypothetical protein